MFSSFSVWQLRLILFMSLYNSIFSLDEGKRERVSERQTEKGVKGRKTFFREQFIQFVRTIRKSLNLDEKVEKERRWIKKEKEWKGKEIPREKRKWERWKNQSVALFTVSFEEMFPLGFFDVQTRWVVVCATYIEMEWNRMGRLCSSRVGMYETYFL